MSLTKRLTIITSIAAIFFLLPFKHALGQTSSSSTRTQIQTNLKNPFDEKHLLLDQLHEAHRQIVRADLFLIEQMMRVASQIKVYLKVKKTSPLIPDTYESNQALADFLASKLPQNPYGENKNERRIKVALDPSITKQQVSIMRSKQPSDWKAKPGTISVIHNGFDLFVIWGANYLGEPVKIHQLKPQIKPGEKAKIISIQLKF